MPISKVQQLPNGALIITVPKTLAELMKIIKGDCLEWELKDNKISLTKKTL